MGTAYGTTIDGTPTNGASPYVDSLVWGGAWRDTNGGTVTISYAVKSGGDPNGLLPNGGYNWFGYETAALSAAMATWEAVANIDFVSTSSAQADAWMWVTDASGASGALGWSEVAGYGNEPLYTVFNGDDATWWSSSLLQGGYAFVTIIHELGHLLGLAHPHDGGGAPDATAFPGVFSSSDLGDFNQNQGIYTVMSYNDGYKSQYPGHSFDTFGWAGSPMALDIAAIQAIYGKNMGYRTGNDVYSLPKANAAGTFWSCIWDAGGTDTISNAGATTGCTIDLRGAPLVGPNAGGFVSSNGSVIGGYTIANGALIENATGGNGGDQITGNGAANRIIAAGGNDWLVGNGGNDTIDGQGGNDSLRDGGGDNWLYGGGGSDTILGGTGHEYLNGGAANDYIAGSSGNDRIIGDLGRDTLYGGTGADLFIFGSGSSGTSVVARDTVMDFVRGQDRLNLSTLDANAGVAGDQVFRFLGGSGPIANGVWMAASASGIVLYADQNGDAVADFAVDLRGLIGLTASDMIL